MFSKKPLKDKYYHKQMDVVEAKVIYGSLKLQKTFSANNGTKSLLRFCFYHIHLIMKKIAF